MQWFSFCRVVPESDRSLAIGFGGTLISIASMSSLFYNPKNNTKKNLIIFFNIHHIEHKVDALLKLFFIDKWLYQMTNWPIRSNPIYTHLLLYISIVHLSLVFICISIVINYTITVYIVTTIVFKVCIWCKTRYLIERKYVCIHATSKYKMLKNV